MPADENIVVELYASAIVLEIRSEYLTIFLFKSFVSQKYYFYLHKYLQNSDVFLILTTMWCSKNFFFYIKVVNCLELISLHFISLYSFYAPRIFTIARNTLLRSLWYCAFKKAENNRLLESWKKNCKNSVNIVCITLNPQTYWIDSTTALSEEIRRLRSLQNDLHNNWLYMYIWYEKEKDHVK